MNLENVRAYFAKESHPNQYGKRVLNRTPSPELTALDRTHPHIFFPEDSSVCPNTTMNFVGALIATQISNCLTRIEYDQNMDQYYNPKLYSDFIENIPLFSTRDGHIWDLKWNDSEKVLVKNDCGKQIGLVTSGPLAGILIRPIRYSNCWRDGGNIIRVLNDEIFACTSRADYPYHTSIPITNLSIAQKETYYRTLDYKYEQLALETIGVNTTNFSSDHIKEAAQILSGKGLLITDMLSFQCELMNMPFDKSGMHILSPENYDARGARKSIEKAKNVIEQFVYNKNTAYQTYRV